MQADSGPTDTERALIAEYQGRKREFLPRWILNCFLALPGFLLFIGGSEVDNSAIALLGFTLFAAAGLRGFMLMSRHRGCPACNVLQLPGWQFPFRRCAGCGARLSLGAQDST